MQTKTSVNSMHHQDIDWLRELDFYKGEIAILSKRLEEVIVANTHTEVTSQVEHFQNKFIVLRDVIDTLGHDIKGIESNIERLAAKNPGHISEHTQTLNSEIYGRMKNLSNDFSDSRFELNKFLSKAL